MKIFAAGMNYAAHKLELEGTIRRPEEPVVFLKPDSALLKDRKPFFVPDFMGRIDYEAEIVVRICRLGKGIPERFAHRYYDAVTLGIDFTARDMQHQASENGQPWTICKGFDGSAAIGQWLLLDGSLTDTEVAGRAHVYNNFREAMRHIGDSATLYIVPNVYWVDNPDSPAVVKGQNGREPFGITIRAKKLHFIGKKTTGAASFKKRLAS